MDALVLMHALILGVVEGLTEFLPVSSTGHLIIVGDLLQFNDERGKIFEIFIQLGAILGVVWHYRARLLDVAAHLHTPGAQRFVINLFVAFLPAAVLGLLLHSAIKAHLFNPITVAGALIVGGVLILVVERLARNPRLHSVDELRPLDAFKVGLAQSLALFPGVSRAGATIIGGLALGLSRTAATEFSFFLAMPTMFAATFYDLYKGRALLSAADLPMFAVGFVTAFLTALVVVRLFLAYVGRHHFTVFAWYRIGFGLAVLAYFA